MLQSNAQIAQKIYASVMKNAKSDGQQNGAHQAIRLHHDSDED
jgi:hypothetical protein